MILFFLCGVAAAIVLSLLTIAVIRKSCREILLELCGTASRANYWLRTSETCLFVTTLLSAIAFQNYQGSQRTDFAALFWILTRQVSFVLATVLACLLAVSLVILKSLPHFDGCIETPGSGQTGAIS
jgi:hypothetical protein